MPELDRAKLVDNFDRYINYELKEVLAAGKTGINIGIIDGVKLQGQIDVLAKAQKFTSFKASTMFTNEFLK